MASSSPNAQQSSDLDQGGEGDTSDDDGEAIEPEIEPKETEISVSGIDEIMNAIKLAKDAIARHDPNAARKSKSEDVLTSLSKNYKLLRDKKTSIKKQITLDSFFKKP